jgi:short subunit dehydrogenase-like uncharacterized protein
MIYGANGYTGRLIAEEAARRGLSPIVAGRSERPVREVGEAHGFEVRVFDLDGEVAAHLDGVDAVLLAAGPFSRTSGPMVEACLATGTHYLDITGEIRIFEACQQRGDAAREAGCVLLPGVGFDVVPTDCLAASLAAALPEATELELAFRAIGSPSAGTAKTMVEGLPEGGAVREDGRIRKVPAAYKTRRIPFRDKERPAVSIPWGDVSTAYHSTGIGNIVVYMAAPPRMIQAMKLSRPLGPLLGLDPVQRILERVIESRVRGPDAEHRAAGSSQIWGRVCGGGRQVEGTLVTPEGYALTAVTAVESAHRVLGGQVEAGAHTPSTAFGPGFITEFDGCDLAVGQVVTQEAA